MAVKYTEFQFTVSPLEPTRDILVAELGELGFESFEETEEGLNAYIPSADVKDLALDDLWLMQSDDFTITYSQLEIEPVNWNEEWEKNFEPIEVDGKCTVRAPFHAKTDTEFDIVIEPKMSFGTGHHETTHLMIKHLLKLDVAGKKTLDMGCGTGVLAILAAMKGAGPVEAIDIDPWCVENTTENCERNAHPDIKVELGTSPILVNRQYDLIIANINRNVLLEDIPVYASCLNDGGTLLLSGFYTEDIPLINSACNAHGINFTMNYEKNNWVACKFAKN